MGNKKVVWLKWLCFVKEPTNANYTMYDQLYWALRVIFSFASNGHLILHIEITSISIACKENNYFDMCLGVRVLQVLQNFVLFYFVSLFFYIFSG